MWIMQSRRSKTSPGSHGTERRGRLPRVLKWSLELQAAGEGGRTPSPFKLSLIVASTYNVKWPS